MHISTFLVHINPALNNQYAKCVKFQNYKIREGSIKLEMFKNTKYANIRYNEKREIRGVCY
jgi:hypothetical protein